VPCTRATLQVGRGGCNEPSMYCDTNLGKIVDGSTPNSYIRCFLPHPFVPTCSMPCPCLRKRSVCACLPYVLCLNRFELSGFCVRSARWACARASTLVRACALYDMQRRSARQLLGMWVHAYFFPATCNKHWVVHSFGNICYLLILALAVILSPIPLTTPCLTILGPKIPRVLFPS